MKYVGKGTLNIGVMICLVMSLLMVFAGDVYAQDGEVLPACRVVRITH